MGHGHYFSEYGGLGTSAFISVICGIGIRELIVGKMLFKEPLEKQIKTYERSLYCFTKTSCCIIIDVIMNTTENQKWQLDLLRELIRTSFKLRYNDSVLGFIWVILKPLLTFTVLFIVFSNFKSDVYGSIETFQVYLLVGVVFYGYFSESILSGMDSLLGLAHIILKVQFPKQLAVLSSQGLAHKFLFLV